MEPNPPSPPPIYIILKGHVPWHGEPGFDVKGARYTFRNRNILRSFFDRPRAQGWLTADGRVSVPSHEQDEFMLEYWAWVDKEDRNARARGRVDSMDHGPTSVLAGEGGHFRGMEMEQEEQVIVPGLLSALTNVIRPVSRVSSREHSNILHPPGQGSRRGHSNIARSARPSTARGQVQTHPIGEQRPLWAGPPPDASPNPYNYLDDITYPLSRGIRGGPSGITHFTRPENTTIPGPRRPQTLIGEERPAWAGRPPDDNSNFYAYLDRYTSLPRPPATHGFAGYVPPEPSGNLYRNPFLDEPYSHSQYMHPTFQPPPQVGYTPPTFQPLLQAGYTPPTFQPPLHAGYMPPTFQPPPPAGYTPPNFQPLLQAGYMPPSFQPLLQAGNRPPTFQPLQAGYAPPNFPPPPQDGHRPPNFQPLQAGYMPPFFQPPPQAGYMPPNLAPPPQAGYTPPNFQPPPRARYTATSGPLPPQRAPTHAPSPLNPNSASFRPGTLISAPEQGDEQEHGRGMLSMLSPNSVRRRRQEGRDRVAEETDETDEPGSLGKRQR